MLFVGAVVFALGPILLAKLWSVLSKLFDWPPVRSVAHALERASLVLLVGGAVFQFVTGILNIDYWYAWKFSFYDAHLYGAWAFIAGFVVHVALKLPVMVRSLRSRSLRRLISRSTRRRRQPGSGPRPPVRSGVSS